MICDLLSSVNNDFFFLRLASTEHFDCICKPVKNEVILTACVSRG